MCRNQKFLHIWHVSDVENVSTYVQFMLFCCKIDFVTIYALLSENLFCRDLRTFVWRKIEPKIASVEKKWQIWGMNIQGVSKKSEFSENQLWQILLWLVRNPYGIFDKSSCVALSEHWLLTNEVIFQNMLKEMSNILFFQWQSCIREDDSDKKP